MIRRLVLALAPLLLVPALLRAGEEPRLRRDGEGRMILAGLPEILGSEEVRPHLDKGLTTTLLLRVETREAPRRRGGARVEVRYELWDEVFHVATSTLDGRVERLVLDSFAELGAWWRGLEVVVFAAPAPEVREARVALEVIPFSRAEQRDTQRWFSESLDEAGKSGTENLARPGDRPESLDRTFHLLMATSIERRALHVLRWQVAVAPPEELPAREPVPP